MPRLFFLQQMHVVFAHLYVRSRLTAVLLVMFCAASAFGCVTGVSSSQSCASLTRRHACVKSRKAGCRPVFRQAPTDCSFRSFTQSQPADFRPFVLGAPQAHTTGAVPVRYGCAIVLLSIGSPQTDRGPPRS